MDKLRVCMNIILFFRIFQINKSKIKFIFCNIKMHFFAQNRVIWRIRLGVKIDLTDSPVGEFKNQKV